MKAKSFAVIVSGMAAVLCLAGAGFPQTSSAQTESAPVPVPDDSTAPVATDDSTALPSNIDPSTPLGQVVKLVQSGVSEDVIMAYVTNSISTFNLDPDKIIYLKDIGAPDELVTTMMQRDQTLQVQTATAGYLPPPQTPPQTAPAPETAVAETTYVAPPPTVVTVDYFNNTLAPYGSWVYVAGYGRCWRPTVTVVNAGWQPYCDHGHWVWTDCGWYWISDYSWGWAPFHYGRWFCNARLGWCWYPDTIWGPSWVTWRYSDNYCGWAPLPPHAVYRTGIGFFYNGASVSVGFNFGLGVSAYTFVPTGNFCDPHPRHYRVEPREATQIYNQTTIINNFDEDRNNRRFVNHGIDPGRITAVTRRDIQPVAIHETDGHGARGEQFGRDGRTLYVNRPHFSDNPSPANQGTRPRNSPPPSVGSAYQGQGPHNGNQNNHPSPPRNYQPVQTTPPPANQGATPRTTPPPPAGSAYQGQMAYNGNQNNHPSPPRNYQPVPTTPPGQRPYSPPAASSPPGRSQVTPQFEPSPAPGFNHAPSAPVQPQTPNYNSTDNRRYPSPHMQQTEQPNLRMNQGSAGGRVGAAPPLPSPPVQSQQPNYVSPRNEPSPVGSRANDSQSPSAGGQSHGVLAPSSPPAQSHGSGGYRNQNGQ